MMLRTVAVMLLLSGVNFAQGEPIVYAQAPPGQGENGDWAFFSKYRAANAALPPDVARVVFLGDSITESWAKEPFIAGSAHYVGRGIGGQTAPQLLVRFRADVIALHPRVVHIMAGTNDLAANNGPESNEEIEDAIQSMTELAIANHIKVVLASIPPAADFEWHRGLNPIPRIRLINRWIESYARRAGVVYVDYSPALATADGAMQSTLSKDGVHPNPQGYLDMQPLAQAAIASALGKK